MGGLSIMHWAIVLLVIVLLFGARKLPDTARGLARSLRIFKSEMADEDASTPRQSAGPTATSEDRLSGWPKLEQPAPAVPITANESALPQAVVKPSATPADELHNTG